MTENIQSKWTVDPAHSNVHFKVKHLGIANVNGAFDRFGGNVQTENEDFNNATVHFEVDTDSLNTKLADRDKFLISPDFMDTQKFPKMLFDGVLMKKEDDYELSGELTIRETKRPVVLEAEFTGSGKGRFNDMRAGFEVTGKINRKDYGLTWNMLTEAGSLIVGEEVKLHFDIELIKQAQ